MAEQKRTITLTFGEQSENHIGMEKNGNGLAPSGFSTDELEHAKTLIEEKFPDCKCELIRLDQVNLGELKAETASILIVRNGVKHIADIDESDLFIEQSNLEWDRQYYDLRRKKVLNKNARYNLCYGRIGQEPDYENKKGRIVALSDVPLLKHLRRQFKTYFGDKAKHLQVEGNYYYDVRKCGIGYHGDGERKKVIAVRLGASMPLCYQWYQNSKKIGERIKVDIHSGDIYVMSEKASGFDWKKRKIMTLRHAAGCDKYIR